MNNRDINTKIQEAQALLEMINGWISNIDTKISLALAFDGILIGIICSNISDIDLVFKFTEENNIKNTIDTILIVLIILLLIISIIKLLSAIIASIHNTNDSIIFFGSIAKKDLNTYKSRFSAASQDDVLNNLIEQIHTNSVICTEKVKRYNEGIKAAIGVAVLWCIIIL